MSTFKLSSFFALLWSVFLPLSSFASVSLHYSQSQDFWGVLGKIQSGVADVASANALLNQTYGAPVGADVFIEYRPEQIDQNIFTLRDARIEQVGYAVSSNPILPQLFGWEGQGIMATVGWQFIEVYGGEYFGKRVDAVSTDLIDRGLINPEDVAMVGAGVHYKFSDETLISVPAQIEVYTRSTDFISNALGSSFYNRWKVQLDVNPAWADFFLIFGQNPNPGFGEIGPIWDYLWQISALPDFLSIVGAGVRSPVLDFWKMQGTVGFFGGYVGAELQLTPLDSFQIKLHSYGYETSAAYQGTELRLWGADLSYLF